ADLVQATFETERLAREEYAREPADRRAVWDAFAAGLNYYLGTSGVQPRVIGQWEPWMFLALPRAVAAQAAMDGLRSEGDVAADGSSAWAVAPSRTEAGHALLFQSRDAAFAGGGQPYEVHVHSDAGWHVRGYSVLGSPVPRAGHNEHLAWSHTLADTVDAA